MPAAVAPRSAGAAGGVGGGQAGGFAGIPGEGGPGQAPGGDLFGTTINGARLLSGESAERRGYGDVQLQGGGAAPASGGSGMMGGGGGSVPTLPTTKNPQPSSSNPPWWEPIVQPFQWLGKEIWGGLNAAWNGLKWLGGQVVSGAKYIASNPVGAATAAGNYLYNGAKAVVHYLNPLNW